MGTTGQELLAGRTAVVTGAARGLGLAVARRFVGQGAAVALADVDGEGVREAADELRGRGGRVVAGEVDVTDAGSLASLHEEIEAALGPIDIVVANAGILVLEPALELDVARWRRVLDVNLTGVFLTAQAFVPGMVARGGGGAVIVTSSLFGQRGGPGNAAYSASKFGLDGFVQSLAAEVGAAGIRVNAVCPGQVDTDMLQRLLVERAAAQQRDVADLTAEMTAGVALGRLGHVDEVADTFVYLASDLSRYVTGESIVVDGGWRVT